MFVVNTNGGQLRQILPTSADLNMGVQSDWSPQGNEIIVSLHVTPGVFGSIWVVHADGSGQHRLDYGAIKTSGNPDDDPATVRFALGLQDALAVPGEGVPFVSSPLVSHRLIKTKATPGSRARSAGSGPSPAQSHG